MVRGVREVGCEIKGDEGLFRPKHHSKSKLIRHSKELVLRKRVAKQEETFSLLMFTLDLLLEQ